MPFIHIQVSGDADDALARRIGAAAAELTQTLLGKDPALTAVAVAFVPAAQWFVAGQDLAGQPQRAYHWQVSVTDETNTKAEKARYLQAVHEAMDVLLGGVVEHAYVHVVDARASAYGYGGRSQEWRYQRAV
jgi:4-oxalocrotonate tautomerase